MKRAFCLSPGLAFLCIAFGAVPPHVHAENTVTPTTPNPNDPSALSLAAADFQMRLQVKDGDDWAFMTTTQQSLFFNRARCECETPFRVTVDLTASGRAKLQSNRSTTAKFRLRIGDINCVSADPNISSRAVCDDFVFASGSKDEKLQELVRQRFSADLNVRRVFFKSDGGMQVSSCSLDSPQKIWLSIDANGDGVNELGTNNPVLSVDIDGQGPPLPTEVTVSGGNEALEVNWKGLETAALDFDGYLVFCARGGTLPVFNPSYYSQQYFTASALCPDGPEPVGTVKKKTGALTLAAIETVPNIGDSVPVPTPMHTLDPAFLCANRISSQTSARISILQNGIPYVVGVSAVDKKGNASPIEKAVLARPIPTQDFYRGYRSEGGAAEGGFCSVGSNQRRPSAGERLAIAGICLGLVLPAWKRRRRRS